MTRPTLLAPVVLLFRLGTYPPKLAHEATHFAAVRPFIGDYDLRIHPLGPTRFSTPDRYAWPLMALGALAPTIVGTAFAVVMAVTEPELFTTAFTTVPYLLLAALEVGQYAPPDNLLAWLGVDLFWFVYTWPSSEDLAALSPGSGG